jgi:hypothetical protein
MPSGVSDYGSATWLSALFGVVALPTEYWIALCTHEPGVAMDGVMLDGIEPNGNYARQHYPAGASAWASNGPYLTNTQSVSYPTPSEDWGYLTHFALCSAPSAGQVYAWGEMNSPQYITSGIAAWIPNGSLVLGLHALDASIAA